MTATPISMYKMHGFTIGSTSIVIQSHILGMFLPSLITGSLIKKYGVWGLMIFVMIPLPVTGAYIGTIAAFIFGISYQKSLIAISSGITISSIMVASFMHLI